MNAAAELVGPAILDDKTLADAAATAERTGTSALDVLEQATGQDAPRIAEAVAGAFGYRCLATRELMQSEPAFDLLPSSDARRRSCVLIREGAQVTAVITDPFDATLRPWIEARVTSSLRWAMAARADVTAFLASHEQSARAIDSAVAGAQKTLAGGKALDNLSLASINEDSSPIVKLVHSTVFDALRARASDIHLECEGSGLVIRYRIDGVLVNVATVAGVEVAEQVLSRIKVMSELDIAERRVPQDGRFKIAIDGRPIDFRVSIMPSIYGEDAVLRVLDLRAVASHMQSLHLDSLGFDAGIVDMLRRLAARPHGMLLVTGPTGSGKTTTLYAALTETNTGNDKIVTIEDPVEYQLAGVLQIPVNEKKGLTFARGLRSILRHDPDKIMVGEIRDPETAQIAIQSALTGHLVFTTVHANNVFDVLGRFMHMGVDDYSFVAALNAILAQRLVRVVCDGCAERARVPKEMLKLTALDRGSLADAKFRSGTGCAHCRGTGYHGRVAVGELLVLTDEMREQIVARAPIRQLKQLALRNGSRFLHDAALDLVWKGVTTIDEVNRVTAVA